MSFLGVGKMNFGREDYGLLIPTIGPGAFAPAALADSLAVFDEDNDYFTHFRNLFIVRNLGTSSSVSYATNGKSNIVGDQYLYVGNAAEVYTYDEKDGTKTTFFGPIGGNNKNVIGLSLNENEPLEILNMGSVNTSLGSVSCLEKGTSGDVYIGGNFTNYNSLANGIRVAKWNGVSETVETMSTGIGSNTYDLNDYVWSIAFKNNNSIFASYTINNATTEIFEYNGSNWSSLGTANSNQTSLVIDEDENLLACGNFTNIAGLTATRIAVYDTSSSSWTAPYEPGFNSRVREVYRGPTGSDTYFSGDFTTVQGITVTYATKKPDGTTGWIQLGDGFGTTIRFSCVSERGRFYAGQTVNTTQTRFYYRNSDGSDSFTSISRYAPCRYQGETGMLWGRRNLFSSGSKVFLFHRGEFLFGNKVPVNNNTQTLYTHKRSDRGKIYDGLLTGASNIFGFFYIYNKKLHFFLSNTGRVWNGSSWSSFMSTNGNISDSVQVGSDLYITGGGNFNNMINRITKWDGTSFSQLGSGLNNTGISLATDGINLYVGGNFTTAGGVTVNRVAKWDGSSWSAMNTGTVGMNNTVRGLAWDPIDEKLYAVGNFTTAGGTTANRIAVWDSATETWSAVGTSGLNNFARSIAIDVKNRYVYIEGEFTTADGATRSGCTRWNINTSSFENLSFPGAGRNLAQPDDHNYIYWDEIKERLYVTKCFRKVSNNNHFTGICYWDGKTETWNPITYYDFSGFYGGGSARTCYRILPVKTKDIENFDLL